MKELDLLLQSWLQERFERASGAQRAAFEALLELPDPELAHYLLTGQRPQAPDLAAAVEEVLTNARIMSTRPIAAVEPSPKTAL